MTYTTTNREALRGRFETPEAYAGYRVLDPEGRKLGTAKKFFVNAHDELEYIRIKLGFFGLRTVLIPVQSVAVNEELRSLVLQ